MPTVPSQDFFSLMSATDGEIRRQKIITKHFDGFSKTHFYWSDCALIPETNSFQHSLCSLVPVFYVWHMLKEKDINKVQYRTTSKPPVHGV